MDLNDAISIIQFRLGNRTDLAAQIEIEIRTAQERLELSPLIDPWFLVQQSTLVIPQDATTIDLPVNFNREMDDGRVVAADGSIFGEIPKITYEQGIIEFENKTGRPEAYAFRGLIAYIFPLPDTQYHLHFPYVRKDTILSTTTPNLTNSWLDEASMVLVNKTGIAMAQSLKNKVALKDFTEDFQVAFNELQSASVHREDVNTDVSRVQS